MGRGVSGTTRDARRRPARLVWTAAGRRRATGQRGRARGQGVTHKSGAGAGLDLQRDVTKTRFSPSSHTNTPFCHRILFITRFGCVHHGPLAPPRLTSSLRHNQQSSISSASAPSPAAPLLSPLAAHSSFPAYGTEGQHVAPPHSPTRPQSNSRAKAAQYGEHAWATGRDRVTGGYTIIPNSRVGTKGGRQPHLANNTSKHRV